MRQSTLSLPGHLAIIMDGNGRWAERRGLPRLMGHRAGAEAVRRVVEACARRGVGMLSLYAFSSDNWKRPNSEVTGLMRLFEAHLRGEARRLAAEGIRLEVIGRRDRLPNRLLKVILAAESATASGRAMTLRIAIDYSSRAAIAGTLTVRPPDRPTVGPDVDLLLRTGGEQRLSDFLLWECAYAELGFLDVLWPDFAATHLDAALVDFGGRERRFGGLPGRATA
ncbi:MAG: polyprenyl diphosphate synthase [Gemmatimonadota bacterium]